MDHETLIAVNCHRSRLKSSPASIPAGDPMAVTEEFAVSDPTAVTEGVAVSDPAAVAEGVTVSDSAAVTEGVTVSDPASAPAGGSIEPLPESFRPRRDGPGGE